MWQALGDPKNYVEPFAGSLAVLLRRPTVGKVETINDADALLCNFWRAIRADSNAVAYHADSPVNETDLTARHSYLVRSLPSLQAAMLGDPEYYDAKLAGWWAWGLCCWIGSGWCSGKGPWVHDGETLVKVSRADREEDPGVARQLPHLGDQGKGVNRQLPHLGNQGRGVNRKLPHLGNQGTGVNRKLPFLGNQGMGVHKSSIAPTRSDRTAFLQEWFGYLQDRLRHVRVASGDWSRVVTPSVTTAHGLVGVFLDPPYTKGEMEYATCTTGAELTTAVRDWCLAHGDDPLFRIVLCGHAGEHDQLLEHGWFTKGWKAGKGYAMSDRARGNSKSETLWCSPHCLRDGEEELKTQEESSPKCKPKCKPVACLAAIFGDLM